MRLLMIVSCALLSASQPGFAATQANEAETIDYLKSLDFSQLQDVEVSLDDVFDVFDGLVHRRKVSVATGVKQSMARAPAVTTVITAQDIEATGAHDLDEVLQSVPGLHVSRDNFYDPIYSIRGLHSLTNPEVLLMVNGIPMRDLTAGNRGVAWGTWPVNAIARIEVIRGPGSAVHGADAFSGVINIITKQAAEIDGTETGLRLGSHNDIDGWILHGGQWAGMDVAATLEFHDKDHGDQIISADRQTLLDRKTGTQASYAPGPIQNGQRGIDARLDLNKQHWRLRAAYQGRHHLGMGIGAAQALDTDGYISEDRYSVDLTYHNPHWRKDWDVSAQLSLQDRHFGIYSGSLFPPGTLQPYPQRPQGVIYPDGVWQTLKLYQRYTRVGTDALYHGFDAHLVRLGLGYAYEDLYRTTYTTNRGLDANLQLIPPDAGGVVLDDTPAVIVPENARENVYAFIQDTWAATDTLELTLGLRFDEYSDFGSTINPRAALVWETTRTLTSKLLYGRAFRAPSYRELYAYNNAFRGNVNLKPELIETWELAFDWRASTHLNLSANTFYYEVEDKILFVPLAGTTLLKAENQGSQRGYGLEWEARWKISARSSLLFNYAYARSQASGVDIGNYPQHSAYLRSDWLLRPNWYLDIQANWVADRQRPQGDMRPALADYTSVDLTLRYKNIQANHWNVAVGVRNLFDSDRREAVSESIPDDLPLPGRTFFAELRYRF